ncbi:MAG: transcriptional repressor LexA [Proteobacteria bacterium]|nr:transcriptional repressor LexA [Pseudomonadota bacterium]MBU1737179.1 transcriptional repressor LexA [Pseudomonadota bacterium]
MRNLLTPKQQRVLEYLMAEITGRGFAPSLRETAAALGISHAAVGQYIKTLEQKGCIRREGRYGREITVLAGGEGVTTGQLKRQRFREVPIVGRVAAGLPLYAQQEWDGSVIVDGDIYRGDNLFALRVQGDSMKDAGILPGDLVLCEPRQYAENGEIVVALIEHEETTVKRFFLHPDHIELRPESAQHQPLLYNFGEVLIQGKVIGLQRGPVNPIL